MVKYKRRTNFPNVAPLAGAWIEIALADEPLSMVSVAPLAGAWIEMIYILLVSK